MAENERIRKTIRLGGKRISQYFRTKKLADAWYRKMQGKKESARAGVDLDPETISVKEAAKKFIAKRSMTKVHATFVNDEGRMRNYIIPVFGDRDLGDITTSEWKVFLEGLITEKGLSKATANRVRALASRLYNDAIEQESLRDNPIARIKPHDERKTRLKKIKNNLFKTMDEMNRYLKAAKDEDPAYFVYHMIRFNTGLRTSQAVPLQWKDVDWSLRVIDVSRAYQSSNNEIRLGSKGFEKDQEYLVGINDMLFKVLDWWYGRTPFKGEEQFICPYKDGDHFYSWHLRKCHVRVIKRAEVPYITPHGVRHSYATHYLEAGGSLENLQKMLGHKTIATTQIYSHVIPKTMKDKANILNIGGETAVTDLSPNRDLVVRKKKE